MGRSSRRYFIWTEADIPSPPMFQKSTIKRFDSSLKASCYFCLVPHFFERVTVTGMWYKDAVLEYDALCPGCICSLYNFNRRQLMATYSLSSRRFPGRDDGLANQISKHQPHTVCLEHCREGNCKSTPPSIIIQLLTTPLLNKWGQLPQEFMNSLISSIKSRFKACISARGQHTPY